jgi:pyruvate formate-lyase activating enzyme-like uncharacterized protein
LQNHAIQYKFKETKPFYKALSPGCQICGEGNWSCLFINGRCNANCFYCPAEQNSDDLPASQGMVFETAESYAEYINYFGFKGASFSGGEPLLSFEKVLDYLKTLRKMSAPDLYIWMYSNGILASKTFFQQLADNGLNEIRFDIGATGYKLEAVQMAVGIIPTVTIEIPAVPEEKERLKKLLHVMSDIGVKYLNLHQLRLTQYNAPKLIKKNYTYIHAEQPIVPESELTALELLNYAEKENLNIGVNYCSFFFKNRFQKAGYLNRINEKLTESNEQLTQKGLIRNRNGSLLKYEKFKLSDSSNYSDNDQSCLTLRYKKYEVHRIVADSIKLYDDLQPKVTALINKEPLEIPTDDFLFNIWLNEYIERGLREY